MQQRLVENRLAAVVLMLVAVVVLSYGTWMRVSRPTVQPSQQLLLQMALLSRSASSLDPSLPVRLRIPRLSIDAGFTEALGLTEGDHIAVPDSYTEVGWYRYGPTPGERGPAVVLGHVDSYLGPAVLWPLAQITIGDDIFIDREDGVTAHFVVTSIEQVPQDTFPTEAVYGDIEYAGLRLITCSGAYRRLQGRYSHNLIVFAHLR